MRQRAALLSAGRRAWPSCVAGKLTCPVGKAGALLRAKASAKYRLPLSPPALSAVATALVLAGRRLTAIAVKVGEAAYLRPGDLCGVLRGSFIPPSPRL